MTKANETFSALGSNPCEVEVLGAEDEYMVSDEESVDCNGDLDEASYCDNLYST